MMDQIDIIDMMDKASLLKTVGETLWGKLCCHTDGIAIGTTVCALARNGFFKRLSEASAPLPVSQLATAIKAREGYLQLACRLLAGQGFLSRTGDIPQGSAHVALSDSGREWVRFIHAYDQVPAVVDFALSFPRVLAGAVPLDGVLCPLPPVSETGLSEMERRVRLQIQGPLVGAVLTEFARRGILEAFARKSGDLLALPTLTEFGEALTLGVDALVDLGWMVREGTGAALTLEGRIAKMAVAQYAYPIGYLSTFRRVPHLLFGESLDSPARDEAGIELHVDRALDIAFSGEVFRRTCREPFLEIILPLFDRGAPADQPRCVVDTGAGDASLLIDLHSAITARTVRGRHLDRHPLLLVAVEYNRIALETAERNLRAAGLPHLAIFGDIGDPVGIAEALAQAGIDPHTALHVSKSVIHNRTYSPPQDRAAVESREAGSKAVFVDPDGNSIPSAELERNLVELFQRWIPWIGRHGMVVIEAHTVDSETAARSVGCNIMASLDAAHGYSHQYLVEIEVYRKAARAAGLVSRESRDLAAQMVGRPILSIDHFIPRR